MLFIAFRGTKEHWSRESEKLLGKYGPVVTIWLGTKPVVVINDIDIARDAFRRNEIAGRPRNIFCEFYEIYLVTLLTGIIINNLYE